jgi:predicted NUDIX family NTP pyrophosphohydrolase
MSRISAGIVMYRLCVDELQVLLVHPGGPYFVNKDDGSWSIPKGEADPGEDLLTCAKRELAEETGVDLYGPFIPLTPVRQKGGKTVHAWACQGDCDPTTIASNMFTMEWPPRSGRQKEFPEIDRANFFQLADAKSKVNAAQRALIDELEEILRGDAR